MNQTFFLDQQIVGTFGNCQVIYSPNPYVQPLDMHVIANVLFILYSVWVIVGSLALIYYKNAPYVIHRGIILILLTGIGCLLNFVIIAYREAVGRDKFDCNTYLWGGLLSFSLLCGPTAIRAVMLLSKYWASVKRGGVDVEVVIKNYSVAYQRSNKSLNENSHHSVSNIVVPALTAALGLRRDTIDSNAKAMKTIHEFEEEEESTSPSSLTTATGMEKSVHKTLSVARFVSSKVFAAIALVLVVFPVFAFAIKKSVIDMAYVQRCTGCYLDASTFVILIVEAILLTLGIIVAYIKLRNIPDPMDIIWEITRTYVFNGAAALVTFILAFSDTSLGNIEQKGLFTYGWILTTSLLIGYTLICHRVVWKAWRQSKAILLSYDSAMQRILADSRMRQMFVDHLIAELNIENLRFYESVIAWKNSYTEEAEEVRLAQAKAIYNLFISPNGLFADREIVNISSDQRKKIHDHLASSNEVAKDLFDPAHQEIFARLRYDSFARFIQTKEYQKYAAHSNIIIVSEVEHKPKQTIDP